MDKFKNLIVLGPLIIEYVKVLDNKTNWQTKLVLSNN